MTATHEGRLHMVRLVLDWRELLRIGRRTRLPLHRVDTGYLIHSGLRALFGDDTPRPFSLQRTNGPRLDVLAYSRVDAAALCRRADGAGTEARRACDWTSLATKRMPETWRAGQRFAFALRTCPVVRKAGPGVTHRAGAEVDVFLARCWEAGSDVAVDRQEVYRQWLADELARRGGAALELARLRAFQRARLLRRTQGPDRRRGRWLERPDARFAGVVQVTEPELFARLIARGVGRHRAFGFGMLLLRPATVAGC